MEIHTLGMQEPCPRCGAPMAVEAGKVTEVGITLKCKKCFAQSQFLAPNKQEISRLSDILIKIRDSKESLKFTAVHNILSSLNSK